MLKLVPATTADTQTIHDIAERVWSKHYIPNIITQDQMDYMMEWMYSANSLAKQMAEDAHFFMMDYKGQTVGYISINDNDGDLFLNKFYIDTEYQRLNLGSNALALALSEFPGAKTIRLQVNRKNFKAINFYFKNGFTIEKVEDFDIGNNYLMEDYVMLKKLYEK
ncbi:MAG: GNAT family N-acetyltransferase [Sphingobacteriales bacterium JAD_PAG50586_3]|nr:MAG: GNAT family N-acetyltransferase [Sphingobacteriales bacterium JAD_PAG50586_3]